MAASHLRKKPGDTLKVAETEPSEFWAPTA
jgi:hypothetical protein